MKRLSGEAFSSQTHALKGGRRIRDEECSEAKIARHAGCGRDTMIGRQAHDYNSADALPPQPRLQIRPDESTVDGLLQNGFVFLRRGGRLEIIAGLVGGAAANQAR